MYDKYVLITDVIVTEYDCDRDYRIIEPIHVGKHNFLLKARFHQLINQRKIYVGQLYL